MSELELNIYTIQGISINLNDIISLKIGFNIDFHYLEIKYNDFIKRFETKEELEKEAFDALYDFYYKITIKDNVITFPTDKQVIILDFDTVEDIEFYYDELTIIYNKFSDKLLYKCADKINYQFTDPTIRTRILHYFREYKYSAEKANLVKFTNETTVCPIRPSDIYFNDYLETDCFEIASSIFGRKLWRRKATEIEYNPSMLAFDFSLLENYLFNQCIMVAVELWAGYNHDHVFVLCHTTEGLYVIDSYINQRRTQKRPFDFNKFKEFIHEMYKNLDLPDTKIISELWRDFWNVRLPEFPEGSSHTVEMYMTPFKYLKLDFN